MIDWRLRTVVAVALMAAGCASAPPAPAAPPTIPFEKKMAWMLELEDRRILEAEPPSAPAAPPAPAPRRGSVAPATPAAVMPDLTALITDSEARVRRRAALSIGRAGLRDGVAPLAAALRDADPDVRAMAAFALGLIGDAAGVSPLVTALADASPMVRGRAAEALGQIALTQPAQLEGTARSDAAAAIGRVAAEYARLPAVTAMSADDETWPAAPEAEAFRLAIYALVRLHAYEPLAAAVLDSGRPVTAWWPVAYALGRIEDKRAQPALLGILKGSGKYPVAFAARGLGVLKDPAAVEPLAALVNTRATPPEVVASAVRALAAIGEPRAGAALVKLAEETADPNIRLEAVTALGTLHAPDGLPIVQDFLTDPWPAMRAAAVRAAAAIDPERFVLVLSGMERDPQWMVRAALAEVLGTLPQGVAAERVRAMLQDEDRRVIPSVLAALSRLKVPDIAAVALAQLKEPDYVVRAAAARLIGELKPPGGVEALRAALTLAQADAAIDARTAIVDALADYGGAEGLAALKEALGDKDWALRVHAAARLAEREPAGDYRTAIRPVPGAPIAPYDDPQLIGPPYSPHAFIETAKGTIELELAVLEAPQTSRNFMTLARRGFFNGLQVHRVVPNFVVQDGDPRGDGEGGPGYTIRDELNGLPFLRGTLGMALSGKDTGGSQFFITHSPQPHLDARYTAFGHVVSGMDVVDRIQQGDTIQRVRVWDGKSLQ